MSRLTFQVEGHEYQLDGKTIPSVHTILTGGKKTGSNEAMRLGAAKGQEFHNAQEYYLSGREDEISFTEKYYLDLWTMLKEALDKLLEDYEVVHIEVRNFIEEGSVAYAGTADLILRDTSGKLVNADLKTGKKLTKDNCAQQRAYEILNGAESSLFIHLTDLGVNIIPVEEIDPNYKQAWQNKIDAYFGFMTQSDFIEADIEELKNVNIWIETQKALVAKEQGFLKAFENKKLALTAKIEGILKGNSAKTNLCSISYSKGSKRRVFNPELVPEHIQEQYMKIDTGALKKGLKKDLEKEQFAKYETEEVGKPSYRYTWKK